MISVDEFRRSVERLEEALRQEKDEFIRDSVIQRFEFCLELAWKTCRKIMGSATTAPKDVIREMAQNSYISDIDFWLRAVDERNNSSHTYQEAMAERVFEFAKTFAPKARQLLERIQ